jgi:hypothetical protein
MESTAISVKGIRSQISAAENYPKSGLKESKNIKNAQRKILVAEMKCELGFDHPTCQLCQKPTQLNPLPPPWGTQDTLTTLWVCNDCVSKLWNPENLKKAISEEPLAPCDPDNNWKCRL